MEVMPVLHLTTTCMKDLQRIPCACSWILGTFCTLQEMLKVVGCTGTDVWGTSIVTGNWCRVVDVVGCTFDHRSIHKGIRTTHVPWNIIHHQRMGLWKLSAWNLMSEPRSLRCSRPIGYLVPMGDVKEEFEGKEVEEEPVDRCWVDTDCPGLRNSNMFPESCWARVFEVDRIFWFRDFFDAWVLTGTCFRLEACVVDASHGVISKSVRLSGCP